MKPLIVTFFAFLLCFSLFTDKKEQAVQEKIKPHLSAIRLIPSDTTQKADTLIFYGNKRIVPAQVRHFNHFGR